jgi:hypothetical protein
MNNSMAEFLSIRYIVDQIRREDHEKRYVSTLPRNYPFRNWFNDGSTEVSNSTRLIIENIKNKKEDLK